MSSGVVLVAGGQQPLRLHVGLLAPPPASARQPHPPPSPAPPRPGAAAPGSMEKINQPIPLNGFTAFIPQ